MMLTEEIEKLTFKNNVSFWRCISKINNTFVGNALKKILICRCIICYSIGQLLRQQQVCGINIEMN